MYPAQPVAQQVELGGRRVHGCGERAFGVGEDDHRQPRDRVHDPAVAPGQGREDEVHPALAQPHGRFVGAGEVPVEVAAHADPQRSAAVGPAVLAEREEFRLGRFRAAGKTVRELVRDEPEQAPAFHERVLHEHARG